MGILLDTCAIIYMAERPERISRCNQAIAEAAFASELFVSPVSAWEIGRLAALGRIAASVNPIRFFRDFLSGSAAELADLSPEILVASSFLPGNPHKDPMDRILLATARELNVELLTDDRAILAYGEQGHVKTLSC